ncbi:AAA family ATPase [Desulfovermiculus halophilus]|jgi:pilus assembly protein CpaE|uniref:AAA family ATPase n=1 Tax=Desulfovermiculus halophilus TaxID=339722 RepID=UPI000482B7E0|nr:AAA family ATPase [Desulfovermiculus halophilus]
MTDTQLTVLLDIQTSNLKRQVQKVLLAMRDVAVSEYSLDLSGDVLITELSSSPEQDFQAIQGLIDSGTVTDVFLLSASTEQDVLLRSIRVGVREFLPLPLDDDELSKALTKLQSRRKKHSEDDVPDREGRVVTVLGSKGGAGTTSIAVNLAITLAQRDPTKSVLLMDINVNLGEVPLFLNFTHQYNWGDLARNIKRMDETFLRNVLFEHATGLNVLPGPEHVNGNFMEIRDLFGQMLSLLRSMFDTVVIDAGHSLNDLGEQAVLASDTVLVISQLNLPYLANTNRIMSSLRQIVPDAEHKLKVVINRNDSKSEVSLQEAEQSLKTKIFWSVPGDYKFALSAINQGKPFVQVGAKHKLTKSIQELAAKLVPEAAGKKEAGRKWFFR